MTKDPHKPHSPPTQLTLWTYVIHLKDPDFAPQALQVAAVVGTLIFMINHGSALISGAMTRARWISAGLTFLVPYCVSIHGQLVGKLKNQSKP